MHFSLRFSRVVGEEQRLFFQILLLSGEYKRDHRDEKNQTLVRVYSSSIQAKEKMKQLLVFLALFATCLAADAPSYPAPGPKPAYPAEPLMPYNFGYAVKDDPTYNNFAHQETADTKAVTGSYRVALPDGRMQIVTYKADEYGYVADVKYEGEAKYPETKPNSVPYPSPTSV